VSAGLEEAKRVAAKKALAASTASALERVASIAKNVMRAMQSAGNVPQSLLNDKGLLILGDGLEQWKDRLDEVRTCAKIPGCCCCCCFWWWCVNA